ncbi:MAG: hypothetical protein SRB2_00648 [Desulfobacteraceae bacterium Eth-SRB2]|nr:MAG: hypothetical protein SRB2_00648 [Desulfobacteraceae bacterium Eth-SRB2]
MPHVLEKLIMLKKRNPHITYLYPQEKQTMALTKVQIVKAIHNQTGFLKNRSSKLVETLLELIKSTRASGIKISKFS